MLRDRGGDRRDLPETVQGLIAARLDLLEPDAEGAAPGRGGDREALLGRRARRHWRRSTPSARDGACTRSSARSSSAASARARSPTSSEYALPPPARPRRRLRPDPARRPRREAPPAPPRWIEQLGRREDHAEMLAHHYLQALELTAAAGGSTEAFAAAARAALADAGDRAFALNAYDAAARFFRAALDLLPARATRGRARSSASARRSSCSGRPTPSVLERADDELLAAGDVEGAAEAETALCRALWLAGDRDAGLEHLARALGARRRPAAVAGEGACDRARLAAPDARRRATTRRSASARRRSRWRTPARARRDRGGGADQHRLGARRRRSETRRAGRDRRRRSRSPGRRTLAFEHVPGDGKPRRPALGKRAARPRPGGSGVEAGEEAEQYGQKGFARWFRGRTSSTRYELGDWDAAHGAGGCVHRRGRGGLAALPRRPGLLRPGAASGSAAARPTAPSPTPSIGLELARRAKDPADRLSEPRDGGAALLTAGDRRRRAAALAEEFLAAVRRREAARVRGSPTVHVLAWTLARGGRGEERGVRPGAVPADVPWARAAIAFARGDPGGCRDRAPGSAPSPRRRTAASRRPGPATSPSSSRRSRSTARSARRATCARASRSCRVGLASRSAGTRPCGRRGRCQSAMPPWSTGRASTPAAASTLAATAARGPLSQIVTTRLPSAAAAP